MTRRSAAGALETVLVSGEPGIGKSRLLTELYRLLDQGPREVSWRQGRCPPYGEGIAFWPLGEIVKAQAGILDTDSIEVTERKLLRTLLPHGDAQWIADRLRPLVGLEPCGASQEENFAAWNGFLGHIASRRPTIVVVEDLHWADAAMLAFLRQLAQHEELPLLLILTARTHFVDAAIAAVAPAALMPLEPLDPAETAALAAGILGQPALPDDAAAILTERCGGNPLYAEEYVRLLKDRGLVDVGPAGARITLDERSHCQTRCRP